MAFRINQNRTFKHKVTVQTTDGDGKPFNGHFFAVYRVVPIPELSSEENAQRTLLDLALISIEGLEYVNQDNQQLEGEALVEAVKADGQLAALLSANYLDALPGKARR